MKGEKRCKMFGNCTNFTTHETCTTGCEFYVPKNPDEELALEEEVVENEKKERDIVLGYSTLPKFDKKHEFFIMKKHVFVIQSVSPKKIVLKYKRRLNNTDGISDGCYTFKNKEGKLLDPLKVFAKLDKEKGL